MYRTLSSYDVERGAFMTWVTTITRNLLVDHFRKSKQDRMTDSLDATPSEHEDAMPLSEKIEDKAPPADTGVQSRETAGTGAQRLAETVAGTARSSDSARLAGYGLQRNCRGTEGSGGYGEIKDKSRACGTCTPPTTYI